MNIWHRVVMAGRAAAVWQQAAVKGADGFAGSWNFGKPFDAQRVPPPTSLYDSPVPLALVDVGSPIRSEAARKKALPPSVTVARILYHTPTSSGKYAVASDCVVAIRRTGLFVTSGDDALFTPEARQKVAVRLRAAGIRTPRSVSPGVGSNLPGYGSLGEQIAWIADRLSAASARSNAIDSGNREQLHG
jgi:hypothetical protein